jgi:hypothetical protein
VLPHRRDGTGQAVDRLDSARQSIGDHLSKQRKPIQEAKEKQESDIIHGIEGASCGERIPLGPSASFFPASGGFIGDSRLMEFRL